MKAYFLSSNDSVKKYYDKKNQVVRVDSRRGKLLYQYDKMGRKLKKTALGKNDNLRFEEFYINTYDENKNLIQSKIFLNSKLFKTNIYQIEYY